MIRLTFPNNNKTHDRLLNEEESSDLIVSNRRFVRAIRPVCKSIGTFANFAIFGLLVIAISSSLPLFGQVARAAEPTQQTLTTGTKPVLDPTKYFGKARAGYTAAKECPEVCAKLFCYCGCDLTDEHVSLLDCFTSDHGVDCYICQEEALVALKLKKQNKTLAEIQKTIDLAYRKEYPFDDKSPAYKKYDASKLWKDTAGALDKNGNQGSASSAIDKKTATVSDGKKSNGASAEVVNRQRKKGSCCGASSSSK